jgi:hypothetical protein
MGGIWWGRFDVASDAPSARAAIGRTDSWGLTPQAIMLHAFRRSLGLRPKLSSGRTFRREVASSAIRHLYPNDSFI